MKARRGTQRLLMFVAPRQVAHVRAVASGFPWVELWPAHAEDRDPWWDAFPPAAFTVGENMGEYNGILGCTSVQWDPTGRREWIRKRLIKKHPKWNVDRIERVTDETKSHNLERSIFGCRITEADLRAFLSDVTSLGPVIFVQDDGGELDPKVGGTKGMKASEVGPRHDLAFEICVSQTHDLREVLHFPYWVPVKVTH